MKAQIYALELLLTPSLCIPRQLLTHLASCAGAGRLALPGAPAAAFAGMPAGRILTLNMDVPEAWLVEPVKAEMDLDNLRLSDLGAAPYLEVCQLTCTDKAPCVHARSHGFEW